MKSRVTTKQGDPGTTRVLSGEILPKTDPLLEATGWVDALRAHLALNRLELLQSDLADRQEQADFLLWVLHVLFLVGTEVNDPKNTKPEYRQETLGEHHLDRLERRQSALEERLDLPKAFIVCAATPLAAQLDITATTCRTLERRLLALKQATPQFDTTHLLPFINRLSDTLYILARHAEGGRHQAVDYSVLDSFGDAGESHTSV